MVVQQQQVLRRRLQQLRNNDAAKPAAAAASSSSSTKSSPQELRIGPVYQLGGIGNRDAQRIEKQLVPAAIKVLQKFLKVCARWCCGEGVLWGECVGLFVVVCWQQPG